MVEDGGSAPLVASGLFERRRVYNPLAGASSLLDKMVRPAGIAPASPDWHTGILLLNDGRILKKETPPGAAVEPSARVAECEKKNKHLCSTFQCRTRWFSRRMFRCLRHTFQEACMDM
jgi:hypothetical protein